MSNTRMPNRDPIKSPYHDQGSFNYEPLQWRSRGLIKAYVKGIENDVPWCYGTWGALILLPHAQPLEIYGTTNQTASDQVEIQAVSRALSYLYPWGIRIEIITESKNLVKCFTAGFREQMINHRWTDLDGKVDENRDLLIELFKVTGPLSVTCRMVDKQSESVYMKIASDAAKGRLKEISFHIDVHADENKPLRTISMVTFYPSSQNIPEEGNF